MNDDAQTQDSDDPLIELSGYIQGMLVDGVAEIVKFKVSDIEADSVGGEGNPAIRGICQKDDKLYILLSVHALLMDDGRAFFEPENLERLKSLPLSEESARFMRSVQWNGAMAVSRRK